MDYLFVIGGLVGLLLGGEMLVRGAVTLAQRLEIPPLVIGLTIVGFGTSMPELVTSLQAALVGAPGIALGNVVGSNTANILLILGVSAVLAPVIVGSAAFKRDGAVLMGASLLCVAVVLWGRVGTGLGLVMVGSLLAYLAFMLVGARKGAAVEVDAPDASDMGLGKSLVWLFVGLALTIGAARLLVIGAVALAEDWGMSQAVIGLTIVAVGTSMPELVTSIVAARRGQGDVAFGNVIGSNIFNILGILGITAIVSPLDVPAQIAGFDIWVMIAATLALVVFARTGWKITRTEGAVFLAAYGAYTAFLVLYAAGA